MAQIKTTSLTRWDLTEQEITNGTILSQEHKYVIQNLIADATEEKLNLTFDPTNPMNFMQREAELTGQIGILKVLLDSSLEAEQLAVLKKADFYSE